MDETTSSNYNNAASNDLSLSQQNLYARESRRQRIKTSSNTAFNEGNESDQLISYDTDNTTKRPTSPTSPMDSSDKPGRKRPRRNRNVQAESDNLGSTATEAKSETSRDPTARTRYPPINRTLSIKSPTGDDLLVLNSEDFGQPEEDDIQHIIDSAIYDPNRSVTPAPPSGTIPKEVVIVQDKGRFRKATKHEIKINSMKDKNLNSKSINSNREANSQTREYQLAYLVKNVQLYSMAISYLAFGLLSGLALAALIIIPFNQLDLKAPVTIISINDYLKTPVIEFFQRYCKISLSFSNAFTILSTIAVVTAMETRHYAQSAQKKITDLKKISVVPNGETTENAGEIVVKTDVRLRKRIVITNLLCICSWITFASNLLIVSVDEIWTDSIWRPDAQTTAINGYSVAKGPYPYNFITYQTRNSTTPLPWYWQPVLMSSLSQKNSSVSAYQSDLSFDTLWFVVWNDIRCIFAILTWILALLEIRYRANTSPAKYTSH